MANLPSHLIDNKKKDSKWIAKYIRAAYKDYKDSYPDGFYNARDSYHDTMLYMLGKQPITKYKRLLDPPKTANEDQSWLSIDWSIIPIVPKFRRIALGKLKKSTYNITADAIDAIAVDEKNKFYSAAASKILLKEEFEKAGIDPANLGMTENDPQNFEELEMKMMFNYKHDMASEMEIAMKVVMEQNRYEELRAKIIEDIHDFGIAGYKEQFSASGKIKVRRVDPSNLIVSYSNDKNFLDIQYCGEIIELTISDLKEMAGDQITPAQYEEIVENFAGKENTSQFKMSEKGENYDGMRIKVLDLQFYSVNQMVTERRINTKGNKVVGRAEKRRKNTDKKKYSAKNYKVVYEGKWVIDSDVFFDCQLQTNMKRAKNNLTDTTMSYHLVAPDLYQMSTTSIGEQMKPIADQIQIAWYKLQNVMLKARPKGIMIEIGSLEDVPLAGKGGKLMEPLEIIDMYNQTGNLVFRAMDEDGEAQNYKPITELNNGIGDEAQRYFGIITQNIQLLRDILGFNEISDGSTPDPRTLKGVASLANESTNNALSFIKDSERSLAERLSYNVSLRIQDAAKTGAIKGYTKAIGQTSVDFFKINPDVSLHEYGIFLQDRPEDFEKEKFEKRVAIALEREQITIADSIAIENIDNLKQAEQMLAYRIKKNKEIAKQEAAENQERTGAIQVQSAQQAEAAKQQTMEIEAQLKERYLEKEKMLDAQIQESKYQHEKEIALINAQGRIEQHKVDADSKEYVNSQKLASEKEKEENPQPAN